MPSLQLIKTHELATLRLGSHYTGDLIMGQSPVELHCSFVFEGLRAGKSQDYLDAIGFQIFKFFQCKLQYSTKQKKNDSNKIKTNIQGQKEQNMHSFLATRGPRVIRTGGSVAGFAHTEVRMVSLEDHLRSRQSVNFFKFRVPDNL